MKKQAYIAIIFIPLLLFMAAKPSLPLFADLLAHAFFHEHHHHHHHHDHTHGHNHLHIDIKKALDHDIPGQEKHILTWALEKWNLFNNLIQTIRINCNLIAGVANFHYLLHLGDTYASILLPPPKW